MKIAISEIIDCIDIPSDEIYVYFDITVGNIVIRGFDGVEYDPELYDSDNPPAWQLEEDESKILDLIDECEDLIPLPSKECIDEYEMMGDFICTVSDDTIARDLQRAITGKGAFRRFKDCAAKFGLLEEWYKYRTEEFKKIAIEWCQEHKIEYTDC